MRSHTVHFPLVQLLKTLCTPCTLHRIRCRRTLGALRRMASLHAAIGHRADTLTVRYEELQAASPSLLLPIVSPSIS